MFGDLFGSYDKDAREALKNMAGQIVGIGQLLIEKGICTEDEIVAAMTRGQQQLDQVAAAKREEAIEELKRDDPKAYESWQLMSKFLGGHGQ